MSYCRFTEADVYIIAAEHQGVRGFDCCGCSLSDRSGADWRLFPSVAEMLAHIAEHRAHRDFIPADVDDAIRADECWITDGRFHWQSAQENSAEENRPGEVFAAGVPNRTEHDAEENR